MEVMTSECTIENFDYRKIVGSLVRETGMDEKLATNVAKKVVVKLNNLNIDKISARLIRELVCESLIRQGLYDYCNSYTRAGIPVYDIDNIIKYGSRDNANLAHNPETIHKFLGDSVSKEYALLKLPHEIAEAHIKGEIHIHDLDYFMIRPNCLQHDLRWFFKNGLKVDGTGTHTSVAAPPRHAMVAALQAAKIMASSQTNMAGGQSLDNFNIFLAPYMTGLSYEEIKQVAQCMVYELNQQYVARGGQVVFSSVNLETTIPDYLKDELAIKAGKIVGKYSDYYEEALKLANALYDVLLEGDYMGKPHLFPNTILKVRNETFKNPEQKQILYKVCQLFAKYGTPYILNLIPEWQHDAVNAMGCRTRLSGDYADSHGLFPTDVTMRTGNLQYITLNLPRIVLESSNNDAKILELLDKRLSLVEQVLKFKHDIISKNLSNNILPFLSQRYDDKSYYNFDYLTHTVGFCGLNEYVKLVTGQGLHESSYAYNMGLNVVRYLRDWADRMSNITGWRWTVTQSPAETTAGRFAKLDLRDFKDGAIVNGRNSAPYYTNSSHIQVNSSIPLYERAKLEGEFHPLCNGGHITHLFMGENMPNAEGLMSLTEKLCRHTNIGLFDYTKDITVCKICSVVSAGLLSHCPNCNASGFDLEYYSRITGYCQRIGHGGTNGGWNDAKMSELMDRRRY